jgi:cyanate permease
MTLPLDYGRTPSEAGSWTAMMLFGGYLISAATPSLAGWARDGGSSYSAIFAAMAVLSAALAIMAAFLRPSGRP